MTNIKSLKENLNLCIYSKDTNRLCLLIDKLKLFLSQKDLLGHLENEEYENDFISLIDRLMHFSEITQITDLLEFVLDSEIGEIKEYIFNYRTVYPISCIVQTKKFREKIIEFVNTNDFIKKYKVEKNNGIEKNYQLNILGATLTQYHSAFDFGHFSEDAKIGLSKYQISKKVNEMRFESIDSLLDDEMKADMIYLYYNHYLSITYKDLFMKMIKERYPELKLKWHEEFLKYSRK